MSIQIALWYSRNIRTEIFRERLQTHCCSHQSRVGRPTNAAPSVVAPAAPPTWSGSRCSRPFADKRAGVRKRRGCWAAPRRRPPSRRCLSPSADGSPPVGSAGPGSLASSGERITARHTLSHRASILHKHSRQLMVRQDHPAACDCPYCDSVVWSLYLRTHQLPCQADRPRTLLTPSSLTS